MQPHSTPTRPIPDEAGHRPVPAGDLARRGPTEIVPAETRRLRLDLVVVRLVADDRPVGPGPSPEGGR